MYFMLGVCVFDFKEYVRPLTKIPGAIIFIVFVLLNIRQLHGGFVAHIAAIDFVMPLLGIAVILKFSTAIHRRNDSRYSWVMLIALSSYVIYLLHTTFIGMAKSISGHLIGSPSDDIVFGVVAVASIVFATVIPIMLHHHLFTRKRWLAFAFGVKFSPKLRANKPDS